MEQQIDVSPQIAARRERQFSRDFADFAAKFEPNIRNAIRRLRGLEDPDDVRQKCLLKMYKMLERYSAADGSLEAYIGRGLINFVSSEFRLLRASRRHTWQMTTTSLNQMQEEAAASEKTGGGSRRKLDGSRLIAGDEGAACEGIESFELMSDMSALQTSESESFYLWGGLQHVPAAEISEVLGVSHATQCRTRRSLSKKLSAHLGYEVRHDAD